MAYAILLCHDLIPHHHHYQDGFDHHTHSPYQGDQGDETDHHGLIHLLAQLYHSDDGFTFTAQYSSKSESTKEYQPDFMIWPSNSRYVVSLIPPLIKTPFTTQLIYILPYSHPSGLRGPPSVMI